MQPLLQHEQQSKTAIRLLTSSQSRQLMQQYIAAYTLAALTALSSSSRKSPLSSFLTYLAIAANHLTATTADAAVIAAYTIAAVTAMFISNRDCYGEGFLDL